VYGVAVGADGKVGYSAGEDNQLRSWSVTGDKAGKQIRKVAAHSQAGLQLGSHPKEPLLFPCSADGAVKVWKADSLAPARARAGHSDWVSALAVGPDGSLVAAGSYTGDVKVWKVADGSLVKEFNATPGLPVTKK